MCKCRLDCGFCTGVTGEPKASTLCCLFTLDFCSAILKKAFSLFSYFNRYCKVVFTRKKRIRAHLRGKKLKQQSLCDVCFSLTVLENQHNA